ncbi:hypothetical protein N7474_009298 [Penicillium riverlandense]|uniref:uncharacterized protein n=1 Tax=Penicillium riverlandense TaxID=1903569 RepID=UPI002548C947|nr:uncharacterized protein N7474_009298 [Penicillium riverlandense]KAJ5808029.1 hypothetical protein N7474_009298 [Penicillium riverlandense]
MSTLSSLLVLPVLCLASIPLILSAWATVSIAMVALLARLAVVYIEVGCGLLMSYFIIPTSSTSSLLTFNPSEPPSPALGRSRRNSVYTHNHARKSTDSLPSWAISGIPDERISRNKNTYSRIMAEAHNLSPATPLLGLPVSGDEQRDFESVGGWRSYSGIAASSSSKRRGSVPARNEKSLNSASSSSVHSLGGTGEDGLDPDIDADERAWLSLNRRLELPSQVIMLGTGSVSASAVNSPSDSRSPPLSRTRANNPQALTTSAWHHHPRQHPHHHQEQRNHHRSKTTSSVTTSDRKTGTGLSIALSTRPDHASPSSSASPSVSRLPTPFMTPQPYSFYSSSYPQQQRSLARRQQAAASTAPQLNLYPSGGGRDGGSYFALPTVGPSSTHQHGATSPLSLQSAFTSPGSMSVEDRDSSFPNLNLARSMAHYPTSVRHRRRSLSGPHSRGGSTADR